jgi:hypothetical protein
MFVPSVVSSDFFVQFGTRNTPTIRANEQLSIASNGIERQLEIQLQEIETLQHSSVCVCDICDRLQRYDALLAVSKLNERLPIGNLLVICQKALVEQGRVALVEHRYAQPWLQPQLLVQVSSPSE